MPDPFILHTPQEMTLLAEDWGAGSRAPNPYSLFAWTTKMTCLSFSLPFAYTCPGSVRGFRQRKGICRLCYAAVGRYGAPNVRRTLMERFREARDPGFSVRMLRALEKPRANVRVPSGAKWSDLDPAFFRLHDSGDFFSPGYIRAWKTVVMERRDIHFWAPTRVWAMPDRWKSPLGGPAVRKREMMGALAGLSQEPNITLRPSMLSFDELPRMTAGMERAVNWAAPSGAYLWKTKLLGADRRWLPADPELEMKWALDGVFPCPAAYAIGMGATCKASPGPDGDSPCRACWTHRELPIAYRQHGSFKGKRQ